MQKQNDAAIKGMKQNYEEKIVNIDNTMQNEVKKAEGAVFELKLKITDLNHEIQKIAKKT